LNIKSQFCLVHGHQHDFVNRYGLSVSRMTTDMFNFS